MEPLRSTINARANRHFFPGHVWHITHRYHQKKFLLKFSRDRQRYLRWVFEAKKRFGLSVLDYMVTCNHVHLLIKDTGPNVIAGSMQLIAGAPVRNITRANDTMEEENKLFSVGTYMPT